MTWPPPGIDWFYSDDWTAIAHGDCREVLPLLPKVDLVLTDPPFSKRTHEGHDSSADGHEGEGKDNSRRKTLGYEAWDEEHVQQFCSVINCSGWVVVITDHSLAPFWEKYQPDRYVFAPLPSFTPGRSVRLSGDGPSSWTDWIICSRTAAQSRWGTLPGGYINSRHERLRMGEKPIGLMYALVRDYSRKDDLVCDPCMGSGTTLRAAKDLGRRAIGIEIEEKYCEIAARRLAQEVLPLYPPPPQPQNIQLNLP